MVKKKKAEKKYVMHPRFGDKPIASNYTIPLEEIETGRGWRRDHYFPETAIRADTSKQNFSIFPLKIYVDVERVCRECNRAFLFYALEQKYWFEELGFYVDADCVTCSDCRKKDQFIQKMRNTYQQLVTKMDRTKEEARLLKQCALELFQLGFIKDVSKINSIKVD